MEYVALAVGIVIGGAIAWLFAKKQAQAEHANKLGEADRKATSAEATLTELRRQHDELRQKTDSEIRQLSSTLSAASSAKVKVETEMKGLQEKLATDKAELENLQKKFEEHFKNLAQEILDSQRKKFQESGETSIKSIIDPLKERLQELQKNVIEAKALNQDMTKETKSLVLALRGDSATQGRWGELRLSHILDRSGLREGEGYEVQGKGLGLKGEEGEHQKPDVIINIPDPEKPKHVIIDSKVSLTAYDQYVNTDDPEAKKIALAEFLLSIRKHVNDLGGKKYDRSEKLNSPDFVLMFVPIEGAFALAIQSDKDIFSEAWDKQIVMVSPTTLFATLRTVAALWSQERVSRNVMAIAERAGKLHEKFVSFLGDLEEIGKKLKDAQGSYDDAMSKLQTGRGSLTSQVENLKTLGAKTSKKIESKFLPNPEDMT